MTTSTEHVAAEALVPVLWCVNIHGPDDVIPVASYLDAVRTAKAFNDWWLDHRTAKPLHEELDARMWAVPIEWPHDRESHATSLAAGSEEYSWLLDLARRQTPASHANAVKALEWDDRSSGASQAINMAVGLTYTIQNGRDGWFCAVTGRGISAYLDQTGNMVNAGDAWSFDALEAAKAVCQADYDRRILSALTASPSPAGAVAPAAGVVERLIAQAAHVELGLACRGPDVTDATKELLRCIREALPALQPAPHPDTDSGGGQADYFDKDFAAVERSIAQGVRRSTTRFALHPKPSVAEDSHVHPAPQAPDAQGGVDDWTVDDTLTAREILNYLGIGSDASLEPFADRRRDRVAKIIQGRVSAALGSAHQPAGVDGWRDMSSAPKDGTRVLAKGHRGNEVDIVHWGHGRFLGRKKGYEQGWVLHPTVTVEPTCWMPLPSPSASHAAPQGGE